MANESGNANSIVKAEWQPITTAPKDGTNVLLHLGETIPDTPDIRCASFAAPEMADELGYREFAKYGAWMIWHTGGSDWYMVDVSEPRYWSPLPSFTGGGNG